MPAEVKTAPAPTMPAAGGHASGEPRTDAEEEVGTPKPHRVSKNKETHTGSGPPKETRAVGARCAPAIFLVERLPAGSDEEPRNTNAASADNTAVIIAVVRHPERLLGERGLAFHGDVVDLLTDLVLDAMDHDVGEGPDE